MILDAIVLENFGAYAGTQEAVLTPEPGRPVVLFGGMNGGGKTTLLDAIQLAFYGQRARLSGRGRSSYREYLRESINRGSDPREGASITVRYRRITDGLTRHFEISRSWRQSERGIDESVRVRCDGEPDEILTEHWDEAVDGYLPSTLAHLFFFDGEQIKDLAEGGQTAAILGTAVHSLLGVDLVERLATDLKVFERKKMEGAPSREMQESLARLNDELASLDREQERVAMEEGVLVNEAGRMSKEVSAHEERFREEGGELFQRRAALDKALGECLAEKAALENRLREIASGPLPLQLVGALFDETEQHVQKELSFRRATILRDVLAERDGLVLAQLDAEGVSPVQRAVFERVLAQDRDGRACATEPPMMLGCDEDLAVHLKHLRTTDLPRIREEALEVLGKLAVIDERLIRLEADKARVPDEDQIRATQEALEKAREVRREKLGRLEALRMRKTFLQKQRDDVEARLDKLSERSLDARVGEDDRQRMLKHSMKVRETLGMLRGKIVRRHVARLEELVLESFQRLLRKDGLATGLSINPDTFDTTLVGRDGRAFSFDRLSAGERQLLATSLLWGLARASGRPVPTIIDTPLGRLDSSHRRHMVERYFPHASHQVILLSTDEEIVGTYLETLAPYIARSYFLEHDEGAAQTRIASGYFSSHAAAH